MHCRISSIPSLRLERFKAVEVSYVAFRSIVNGRLIYRYSLAESMNTEAMSPTKRYYQTNLPNVTWPILT